MIKVTFECEDAGLASYLILLYEIYTKEEMDMSLGLLQSQLVPALEFLFDKLTDYYIGNDYEIIDSSNAVYSRFSEHDWEFLCRISPRLKEQSNPPPTAQ